MRVRLSMCDISITNSNCVFKYSMNREKFAIIVGSITPNPSSMAIKFGLGKDETCINAVLIASDEINFSIPLDNSKFQKRSLS